MPSRSVPWWLLLVSASFAGLWALLFYCDLFRIEPLGWELEFHGARHPSVRRVVDGSPAARAGVREGDAVVAADGRPIETRLDLSIADVNLTFAEPLRLELSRGGARVETSIPIRRGSWHYWKTRPGMALLAARGVQLLTLGFALLIAFKRPRDPMALAGAWFLATAAVTSIALPHRFASAWRGLPLPVASILSIAFVSSAAVGGAIFTFFALFPRRLLGRRWLAAAACPLVVLLALHAFIGWRIVVAPDARIAAGLSLRPIVLLNLAYLFGGLALAFVNYHRLADITARRRMQVVLAAAVVGSAAGAPAYAYYWMSSGVGVGSAVMSAPGMMAGTLLFLVFPLSFAYAILRHRLFDVSVIVRRGLQYALARHGLAWLVPGLIGLLALDLLTRGEATIAESLARRGWIYLAVLALAGAAHAKRDAWLEALDRRFFRERYNAQRLLRAFAVDIRQSRSLDDLLPRVVAQIDAALHPESTAVLLRQPSEEAFRPFGTGDAAALKGLPYGDAGLPCLTRDSRVVSLARVLQRPVETPVSGFSTLSRELPAGERAALHDARIEILVPIVARPDRSELLIALGPKRSEEPYSQEDLDLLATIADGLALIVDRARPVAADPPTSVECGACGACHDAGTNACACGARALSSAAVPRRLNGRYRLDRRIGEGGMGTVYAATDLALDREIAVKVVREDLVNSPEARGRFERETRTAASFAHPNIVTVHDFGVVRGGRAFIVMELLRGSSLAERLKRESPLPPPLALSILHDVCEAMETAHARGLVHRDLKPANIFLAVDDGGARAKVLDFGIAKLLAAPAGETTASRGIVGTPQYMAPEQLRGGEPEPAWDLWALTVVAHEMLTGTHPFRGRAAQLETGALRPAAPYAAAFFATALSVDPGARPQTARALLAELTRQIREPALL